MIFTVHDIHITTLPRLLVVVDVDHGLLPLPGRHLTLEQDVDLAVGATLHLGKEEVGGDETA